jgi:voltage-gated potassium channel
MAPEQKIVTETGSYDDLPRDQRRRLAVAGTLRTLATVAVLVALYYLLPLDHPSGAGSVAKLIFGVVVMILIVWWQIRAIIRSQHPSLRATEALAFTVPLYLLAFAATYFLIEQSRSTSFTEPLTRTDAMYFSVTVFTTVGFGDISAKSEPARLLVTGQMILDLLLLGLVVRLFLRAVKVSQHRAPTTKHERAPADDKPT